MIGTIACPSLQLFPYLVSGKTIKNLVVVQGKALDPDLGDCVVTLSAFDSGMAKDIALKLLCPYKVPVSARPRFPS